MMLIDHKYGEMSLECQLDTYSPDAVLVVMAVDDSGTLTTAELILSYLKILGITGAKPVILVANKTDLVRSRTVKPSREFKIFSSLTKSLLDCSCMLLNPICSATLL